MESHAFMKVSKAWAMHDVLAFDMNLQYIGLKNLQRYASKMHEHA